MTPEQIRNLRGLLSRKEFVGKIGISIGTLGKWESGAQAPTRRHERRLEQLEIEKLRAEVCFWQSKYLAFLASRNHPPEEPSKIYRRIAAKYHPDRSEPLPTREEILKDLNELWQAKGR